MAVVEWPVDVRIARRNLELLHAIVSEADDLDRRAESVNRIIQDVTEAALATTDEQKKNFLHLYQFVLHLSFFCPWTDVREPFHATVVKLQSCGVELPKGCPNPSRFEDRTAFPAIDWSLPIWNTIFLRNAGRLTWLHWSLSSHMRFLELYSTTIDIIMKGEGPILRPWRHFIAIMAASRHFCEYLIRHQEEMFLYSGGDPDWLLSGLDNVPPKLRLLEPLNLLMAHRPWEIELEHIETLIKGGWSIAEVVQAFVILSTFHGLSSLVFALGLQCEGDMGMQHEVLDPPLEGELPLCFTGQRNWLASLQADGNKAPDPKITEDPPDSKAKEPPKDVNREEVPVGLSKLVVSEDTKEILAEIMSACPTMNRLAAARYRSDDSCYIDFDARKRALKQEDLNWEDHAYLLLLQYYPSVAEPLNEEYTYILEYSNHCIGDVEVDTTEIVRRAMVVYANRLYGIVHDDYNYNTVNHYLTLVHKVFLKKLVCFPERLTRNDYARTRQYEHMTFDDMVHYALIAFESRRVLELIFTFGALARYLKRAY